MTCANEPQRGIRDDRLAQIEAALNLVPVRTRFVKRLTRFERQSSPAPSSIVAFDLDETLLINSWTSDWEAWHAAGDIRTISAWRVGTLPWISSRLSRLRGQRFIGPLIQWSPWLRKASFPIVHVQLRLGAIELLSWLRSTGIELVLVTATPRQRVDYLFRRLPWFHSMFISNCGVEQVVCAEQLTAVARQLPQPDDGLSVGNSALERSRQLHRREAPSMAWKTPLLVQTVLNNDRGYDLLVDDNLETKSAFDRYGLADALVHVDGSAPLNGAVVQEIAQALFNRLSKTNKEMEKMPAFDPSSNAPPAFRFRLEDPYYLPLLNTCLDVI